MHPWLSRKTRLTLTLWVTSRGVLYVGYGLFLWMLVMLTMLLGAKLCFVMRLQMRWFGLLVLATYVAFLIMCGLIRHWTLRVLFSVLGLTHFPVRRGHCVKLGLLKGWGVVGRIVVLSCPRLILWLFGSLTYRGRAELLGRASTRMMPPRALVVA